ncbi:hypothetical protein [Nonomuraea maritima]|uniref:hypothetical protein n=1 Tax=Nonomuraea maritima TaxID=683260 RepID=UPI00371B3617
MPISHQDHATQIRNQALAGHGESLPAEALGEIAQVIHDCCGHGLLKSHRLARGWSVTHAVAQLAAVADAAGLPQRGASERGWRRWENGGHCDADYQDRLCRLFQTGPVQLGFGVDYTPRPHLSGGDHTNRRDALRLGVTALVAPGVLLSGEAEARELTRRSEETDLGPSTLDHVRQMIDDYGHHYARYDADELWESALADRRHVAQLLERRMTLKQRREMYVDAAWLSLVLAWSAHDRGQVRSALAYAADARHHAEQADHPEAAAWSWDVEATTWFYDDRPDRSLQAVQQGLALAPTGSAAYARLTGQLARAHARFGHVAPSSDALAELRRLAEQQPLHARGLFTADAARVWSIAASSSLWTGQYQQAQECAEQALAIYGEDPDISPTRRALTALDLGMAFTRMGNPEDAVAHGILALATPRQASAIATRSNALCLTLERAYPKAAAVTQFRQSMAQSQQTNSAIGSSS